jgi:protocatechuate 3,4-dioxygenase beta subunit
MRRSVLLWVLAAAAVWLGWRWLARDDRGPAATPAASAGLADAAAAAPARTEPPPDAPEPSLERSALAAAPESVVERAGAGAEDARLRGRVVDGSRAPIQGAAVRLVRRERDEHPSLELEGRERSVTAAETVSGVHGEFAFEADLGRPYRVAAEALGFASAERAFCYAGEEVEIVLGASAAVSGRVTYASDGSPVERAWVEARPRSVEGRPAAAGGTAGVETDALGGYRIEGLAPGAWELRVDPPLAATATGIQLELEPGEFATQDVAVEAGIEVRGRVLDARTGAGIAEAEVGQGWTFSRVVRTGADGSYVFPHFARRYAYLHARAEGYGGGEAVVALGGELHTRIDFELSPARAVAGRIVDDAGSPLAGAHVAAVAYEDGGRAPAHDWVSAVTREDGAYEIASLRPDLRHVLQARKEGYGTVIHDFPDDEQAHARLALPDVVLPRPGAVRGELVDEQGAPYPGREITLYGWNPDRGRFGSRASQADMYVGERSARTDQRGRFAFVDVAPGPYYVLRGQLPDSHESFTRPVEVRAGETTGSVRIVFPRGRAIAGRVIASDGGATPVVYVSVDPLGEGTSADVECALDGSFRAGGLSGARYVLTAYPYPRPEDERSGRWFVATSVEDVAAGSEDVVIELRAGSAIRGRVVDLDGRAVAGATVSASDATTAWLGSAESDAEGRFTLRVPTGGHADVRACPPGADPDPARCATALGVAAATVGLELRLPWRP